MAPVAQVVDAWFAHAPSKKSLSRANCQGTRKRIQLRSQCKVTSSLLSYVEFDYDGRLLAALEINPLDSASVSFAAGIGMHT